MSFSKYEKFRPLQSKKIIVILDSLDMTFLIVSARFVKKHLYKCKKWCYNNDAKQKRITIKWINSLFFIGGFIPFSFFTSVRWILGKSVDSPDLCGELSIFVGFCLATIGVCVFRCDGFGCRTFCFCTDYFT